MDLSPHHTHLAGALSAFAARRDAAFLLPADQLRMPRRQPSGTPRYLPRCSRLAPAPTRQYTQRMSGRLKRDQRLTFSARVVGWELYALAGKDGVARVTRTSIAKKLGICERTVARCLVQLRHYGYFETRQDFDAIGMTRGLVVTVLDAMLPYYETQPVPVFTGRTAGPSTKADSLKSSLKKSKRPARTVPGAAPERPGDG